MEDAVQKRDAKTLSTLVEMADLKSTYLLSSLNLAIKENFSEGVKILIEKHPQLAKGSGSENPLLIAAGCGAPKVIIDCLVRAGSDLNIRHPDSGKTPLLLAAMGGFSDTAEALLEYPECDCEAIGNPPKNLRRIDEFHTGQTALLEAIGAGNKGAPVVEVLLRKGANPNTTASTELDGLITPLMQAAMHGLTGIVEMLLTAGVEVDKRDSSDHTALHWAVKGANLGKHTNTEVIQPLIDAGADLNAISNSGGDNITPVLRACDIGDFRGPVAHDMTKILIEAGSDINRQDMYGKTIMHRAISYGWMDILDMVLDRGADMTILDCSKHSVAYDLAEAYDVKVEALLKLLDRNIDVRGTYTYLAQCNICIPNSTLSDVAIQVGNLQLLPYFYAAGSPMPKCLKDYEHRVVMQDKTLAWMMNKASEPQSLKGLSRIGLRRAFPTGCCLEAKLGQLVLPNELVNYTLFRNGVDLSGVEPRSDAD